MKRNLLLFTPMLLLLANCTSSSNQSNQNELSKDLSSNLQYNLEHGLDEIPVNDRNIGFGFNELRGSWSGSSAVEYKDESDLVSIGEAQDVIFTAQKITSYSSLRERLNLDARISLGLSGFGADFTSSIYTNSFLSNFKQYVLVEVSVVNAPQILKHQKLTSNALKLARKGYKDFVESYGTKYVIGKKTGGKLYGLIEIEASNEESLKEISSTLDVSVGLFGSANAKFSSTIQKISENNSVKIIMMKSGGKAKFNMDPDSLIVAAENFAEEVKMNPKVLSLMLSEYVGVENYPSKYASTNIMNRLSSVIYKQNNISSKVEELNEFSNDINYVKLNPDFFEETYTSKSKDFMKQISKQKEAYFQLNNRLIQAFLDGKSIEEFIINDTDIPQIIRKQGWRKTKLEYFIKTHVQNVSTSNWDGQPGYATYPFEFIASDDKNILKNIRITNPYNCVNLTRENSCWWNFGSGYLTPSFDYINGKNHVRGSFPAGSLPVSVRVECDEYILR
jgi:hypothetical protein